MSVAPVPAAPAAVDPLLLRRPGADRNLLAVPVTEVNVLLLGLSPITAAAAVMLAGCGVRGFVVVDDGTVTWQDALAGAFDVSDVGRTRDLCTRRRLRAANRDAAPVTWSEVFVSGDHPGRVILRSIPAPAPGPVPVTGPGTGRVVVEPPADSARLPEALPLIDVQHLSARSPGTALLHPLRPWAARPCPACTTALVERMLAETAARGRPAPSARAAAAAHTAFAAAHVAQAVLEAATEPSAARGGDGLILRPGAPFSSAAPVHSAPSGCPLCA